MKNSKPITINWHRKYHQNHNTPQGRQYYTIRYNGMSMKVGDVVVDRHMPRQLSRLIPEYAPAFQIRDNGEFARTLDTMWRPFVCMAVLMGYMK
jgi:hypothetical protein